MNPNGQVVHLDDEHHALAMLGAARATKKSGKKVTTNDFVSQLIRDAVREAKGARR